MDEPDRPEADWEEPRPSREVRPFGRPAPRKDLWITLIGVFNVLFGIFYAFCGAFAILVVALGAMKFQEGVREVHAKVLLFFLGGFMALVGVALLLLGLISLLAGIGVMSRRPWGRTLTFIVAVFAVILGLPTLNSGSYFSILGGGQVLYGILAIVFMTKNGAEFAPRRARTNNQGVFHGT
jgi:hypothetical protein